MPDVDGFIEDEGVLYRAIIFSVVITPPVLAVGFDGVVNALSKSLFKS